MKPNTNSSRQRGFTIIELMIATAVFSTILLVVLTAITQIGRMYYKGLTTSQTQEVARTVLDRISQEVQFSGQAGTPITVTAGPNGLICIGKSRFFFIINKLSHPSQHALWADTDNDNTGCTAVTLNAFVANANTANPTAVGNNGSELLADGMRIVVLNATTGANNLWAINVKVVFGADDLIEAIDATGTTVSQAAFPQFTVCKGSQIGTQFCAISQLTTTVLKRVP